MDDLTDQDGYDDPSQSQDPHSTVQEKRPVRAATDKIRNLFCKYFIDYCNVKPDGDANLWFSSDNTDPRLLNMGEEDPLRFDKFSWWGPPREKEPSLRAEDSTGSFSDINFKLLRKGTSSQIFTPPPLNLIEFKDEEFMSPKPVSESKLPPELFSSVSKHQFKDSPFHKVAHHFINNARIASETFSLIDYLKISQSDSAKQSLSDVQRQELFDNICYVIQMQSEASFFAASAGYSHLKLDVRKACLEKLSAEDWLKEDLLGSPFNQKELFGKIPSVHKNRVSDNPNMRLKLKAVTTYRGRGRGNRVSAPRGGWIQSNRGGSHGNYQGTSGQSGQGRGYYNDRVFFPGRRGSNRGFPSGRGNH